MSEGMVILFAWFGLGSDASDEEIVAAADVVLDGISDADNVGKTDLHTGRNLRDQLTLGQVEEIAEERKWYSWGSQRN